MMDLQSKREFLFRKQKGKEVYSKYMKELEGLTCFKEENKINMATLEETDVIINNAKRIKKASLLIKDYPFVDRDFVLKRTIKDYCLLLSGRLYLLTTYSKYCGAAIIDSVEDFNCNFSFETEHSGVFSLINESFSCSLTVDFYEEGIKLIEIELLTSEIVSV